MPAVHQAAQRAALTKRVTTHAVRHLFATQLLGDGYDTRTVRKLLGHKDAQTTMSCTHVVNRGGRGVRGPLDGLKTAVPSYGGIRPAGPGFVQLSLNMSWAILTC